MPRPEFVTDADLARWKANILAAAKQRGILAFVLAQSPLWWERVLYPGEWLGEQLLRIGCPKAQASQICYAAAQRFMTCADSWEAAAEILATYIVEEEAS